MSDTNKMSYDPIPVGGPFGISPESKPAFSRTAPEPMPTGGLLPPSRKPVSVSNTDKSLPPGIAPETPSVPTSPPPRKGGVGGLFWDIVKPTRTKGAVVAGVLSLGAGAYGLNLVVPQPSMLPAKVMSEPGKDIEIARVPSFTLERGSAPVVEQLRAEPIVLASATEPSSELPIPAPGKMPDLPAMRTDAPLPVVPASTPSSDIPLPKSDMSVPLPGASPLPKPDDKPIKDNAVTLPAPSDTIKLAPPAETLKLPAAADTSKLPAVGEELKPAPLPKPIDALPAPASAPSVVMPSLPAIDKAPELTIKPATTPDQFKPVSAPGKDLPPAAPAVTPPAITPKLDEVKFTAPVTPAVPVSTPSPVKAESVATPRTDYDEDIVRVRSGDTYASLAKAHYEDDKYGAALREYNRGIDIGLTREIQVPPLYVLKKLTKSSFDRFEPATRPVSATSPVISGPVLDAPMVKSDSDLDWNKPGTPKRESNFSTFSTDRDGLTPKQLAKQLLGDAGEWRKLTDARGQRFGEEEGLPRGTEVRYPKLQADWR